MKSRRRLRVFMCLIFDQGTSLWHRQFQETLLLMGHEVVMAEGLGISETWLLSGAGLWGRAERRKLTGRIMDSFVEAQRAAPIDLFFAYLYPFQFERDLFDEVRAFGVPSVYFFCDNLSHPEVASHYAARATLNWVPEKAALKQFCVANARTIHLPMAANPQRNRPTHDNEAVDVIFAGGMTPFRRKLLGEAVQHGLKPVIYGSGWSAEQASHLSLDSGVTAPDLPQPGLMQRIERWLAFKGSAIKQLVKHGTRPKKAAREYTQLGREYESVLSGHCSDRFIDHAQLNALYSQSRVTLGINDQFCATAQPAIYAYPKMREFEATLSGACFLTQFTEETAELFEPGIEVEVYHDAAELVSKARSLLKDDARRARLRIMGHRRSLSSHTWTHRFERLFAEIGL